MKEYIECHIKPNWLLIYKYDYRQNVIELARLGAHAQIFKRYKGEKTLCKKRTKENEEIFCQRLLLTSIVAL